MAFFPLCMLVFSVVKPNGFINTITTNTVWTTESSAYDNATIGGDVTTSSTQVTSSLSSATGTAIYTGIGTKNGTLKVILSTVTVDNISSNQVNEAVSSVTISYSKDGGVSFTSTGLDNSVWSAGADATQLTCSVVVSGATGDVRLKVETSSIRIGSGTGLAAASSKAIVYDIWME